MLAADPANALEGARRERGRDGRRARQGRVRCQVRLNPDGMQRLHAIFWTPLTVGQIARLACREAIRSNWSRPSLTLDVFRHAGGGSNKGRENSTEASCGREAPRR